MITSEQMSISYDDFCIDFQGELPPEILAAFRGELVGNRTNIGEIGEQWTVAVTGLTRCKRGQRRTDFTNGVQLKTCNTPFIDKKYTGYVLIPKSRDLDIFVIIINPETFKVYFAVIPNYAYLHLKGNTISATFDKKTHEPTERRRKGCFCIWDHRVSKDRFVQSAQLYVE